MFQRITLRGPQASISWNGREAVKLGAWSLKKPERIEGEGPQPFELRASIAGHVDSFSITQRPLLFTAPRRGGRLAGFFCFPVQALHVTGDNQIIATLGPPEY